MKFINLRNYSENSVLNATTRVEDLVARAKKEKLDAVALTDKASYGMVKFYQACLQNDMKPIYGFNLKMHSYVDMVTEEEIAEEEIKDFGKREYIKTAIKEKKQKAREQAVEEDIARLGLPDTPNILIDKETFLPTEDASKGEPIETLKNRLRKEFKKNHPLPKVTASDFYEERLHNILIFPKSEQGKVNIFQIVSHHNISEVQTLFDYFYREDGKALFQDIILIIDYNTWKNEKKQYKKFLEEAYIDTADFYVELQPRNTKEDFEALQSEVEMQNIIITSPLYYLDEVMGEDEDFSITGNEVMKMMKSIESGIELSEIEQEFIGFHFKKTKEIREDFSYMSDEQFTHILTNIHNIVEKVDFHLELDEYQIPTFSLDNETEQLYKTQRKEGSYMGKNEWYFRYVVYNNLEELYNIHLTEEEKVEFIHKEFDPVLEKSLGEYENEELEAFSISHYSEAKKAKVATLSKEEQEIIERIEYEFFIIHMMGFDAYFLIVLDYINWAKNNDILVGPGRGSVAGSILAYLTKITSIDPIKYGLLFFRFMNPSRINMPDVDTDFSDRDKVIHYASEKYGKDNVCPVITFGKLQSKAVFKGVAKAKGLPFTEVNRLTKQIGLKEATLSLENLYEENEAFKHAIDSSSEYRNVFESSKFLYGLKGSLGRHACATIISKKPVVHYCPIQFPTGKDGKVKADDVYITQLEGPDLETLGLLKMDFLGLNTLTILGNARDLIEKNHGRKIDLEKIDLEDQKVFEIFREGRTTNVFQFESTGMKKYLKNLEPDSIEELIAMVSLYRPGPMQFIDDYIQVKKGLKVPTYKDPALKELLEPTNGVCIYQEQIMKMAQLLSGYSLGEADILRRAVGKKKKKVILEQREIFCQKGAELGRDYDTLGEIYDETVLPAASYSFNKSHAACYAYIAYQTAYIKRYYPAEFAVAILMTKHGESLDRAAITLEDAMLDGIKIRPLNVNTSDVEYSYRSDTEIEMGLKTIKSVGPNILEKIVEEREQNGLYKDFEDFFLRNEEVLDKKVLNGLLVSGALEELIETHKGLVNVEKLLTHKQNMKKEKKSGATNIYSLFDEEDEESSLPHLDEVPAYSSAKLAVLEKESIGLMLSHHPFDYVGDYIESFNINKELVFTETSTRSLSKEARYIKLLGIVTDVFEKTSMMGEKKATITLLGSDYSIRCQLNETLYYNNIAKIKSSNNTLVEIEGHINASSYGVSIHVTNLEFKDIEKARNIAQSQGLLTNKKYDWASIVKYRHRKVEIKDPLYINIESYLLKPGNKTRLESSLTELKKFLEKHYDPNGHLHVFLKTNNASQLKDTKMILNRDKKDSLKNKVQSLSGLSVNDFL